MQEHNSSQAKGGDSAMKKYTHSYSLTFPVSSNILDPTECLLKEKNNVINTLHGKLRKIFDDDSYVQHFRHVRTEEQLEFAFEQKKGD